MISDTVTAVIDGATDKSGRDYGGMSGGARAAQCVTVVSSHRTHLFSVEMDEPETAKAGEDTGPHAEASETERT